MFWLLFSKVDWVGSEFPSRSSNSCMGRATPIQHRPVGLIPNGCDMASPVAEVVTEVQLHAVPVPLSTLLRHTGGLHSL